MSEQQMASDTKTIRILIADDHGLFRDALRKLLEMEEDFEVVGAATDGAEAVRMARELKPDILLLDLAMPRLTGIEALRELATGSSPVLTILLAGAVEKRQILEALQLGARGVVLKDAATQLLLKCVRCVMAGEHWVGRDRVSDLLDTLRQMAPTGGAPPAASPHGLTPREREIVAAIVAGQANKDIARSLAISEETVKHHLTSIFNKLGVSNRLELALFAVNQRLIL
ncbi:MAG: response regulator [Candidatus Acidiferrales bacterium]